MARDRTEMAMDAKHFYDKHIDLLKGVKERRLTRFSTRKLSLFGKFIAMWTRQESYYRFAAL